MGILLGYNAVDVYRENEVYAGLIAKMSWDSIGQR